MDKNLVKQKVSDFFSPFPSVKFRQGENIIQSSDPINNIFLLQEGLVKQFIYTENGTEITLHIYRPNSFFPIMLVLSKEPNRYYFQALTEVKAIRAGKDAVVQFLQDNPDVLFNLATRFAHAISGLSTRLETFLPESAYVKICSLLIYLSKAFGKTDDQKSVTIDIPLTHREIASWLGISRETASRQIELLMSKQVITQAKNHTLIINDISALEAEIEKNLIKN